MCRMAKLRVGWMVAGCAPGVLTILTSSLFQSTTTAPDPEPTGAAAAAVPLPVACWYATTANVAASVRATPANAINGFFMVRDFSSTLFVGQEEIGAGVTSSSRRLRNDPRSWDRDAVDGTSRPFEGPRRSHIPRPGTGVQPLLDARLSDVLPVDWQPPGCRGRHHLGLRQRIQASRPAATGGRGRRSADRGHGPGHRQALDGEIWNLLAAVVGPTCRRSGRPLAVNVEPEGSSGSPAGRAAPRDCAPVSPPAHAESNRSPAGGESAGCGHPGFQGAGRDRRPDGFRSGP